jgi:hypothetical protein
MNEAVADLIAFVCKRRGAFITQVSANEFALIDQILEMGFSVLHCGAKQHTLIVKALNSHDFVYVANIASFRQKYL